MGDAHVGSSSEQGLAEGGLADAGRADDVAHEDGAPAALLGAAADAAAAAAAGRRALRFGDGDGRQLVVAAGRVVAQIGQQLARPPHVQVRRQTPLRHVALERRPALRRRSVRPKDNKNQLLGKKTQ